MVLIHPFHPTRWLIWMFVKDGSWNHNLYILVVDSTAIGVGIFTKNHGRPVVPDAKHFAEGSGLLKASLGWAVFVSIGWRLFTNCRLHPLDRWCPTDAPNTTEFWVHKISLGFCVWKEVINVSESKNKHMDSYNTWICLPWNPINKKSQHKFWTAVM